MQQPEAKILTDLPFEILFKITAFLSPGDLCRLAMTCSSLKTVADDNESWKQHISVATAPKQCAKDVYKLTPHLRKGYQPPPRRSDFFSPRPGYCININRGDNSGDNPHSANIHHLF